MHKAAWFLAMILAVCCISTSARSQITFDGCYVGNGYFIPSVPTANINDIAMANFLPNGSPAIFYNPYVVASVQPQTRVFFYYHECAHHVRGHAFGTVHPLAMEQDADCTAIITLVQSGRFNSNDIQVVQADLAAHAHGDWTHLPGTQRAINLYACLGRSAP